MFWEAFFLCRRAHPRARRQWSWCWDSCSRITSLLSRVIGCRSARPSSAHVTTTECGAAQLSLITIIFIFFDKKKKKKLFSWVCAFCCSCTGGSFRGWPRARQTRRARRLSLRANTSSLMECGCRPSAEGRWRRSPTSPSEVATYGLSPTQSQVN